MRRNTPLTLAIAISLPMLFAVAVSAQTTQPPPPMPPDQVAAMCPTGSHWQDAGYVMGGKYREGHCQKDGVATTPNK